MADFTPVDHKDSDPEYRAAVRAGIETLLGTPIEDIQDPETLLGEWERASPHLAGTPSQRFCYLADGTFESPYDSEDSPRGQWQVEPGRYTETTWCQPMPEYGIDEGTWNPETYHCAVTDSGDVVIWNGDGSLLLLMKRPAV